MSDAILGNRFVNADARKPAWHNKGVVLPEGEKIGAVQALERHLGVVGVSPLEVFYKHPITGEFCPVPDFRVITRHPIAEDDRYLPQGVVGKDYNLFQPMVVARMLDEHVGLPIDTAGYLFNGTRLFFCYRMESFDVNKDPIDSYLFLDSPFDGLRAANAGLGLVRVVCQNTLRMAQDSATESFRIVHNALALQDMASWLSGVVERVQLRARTVKEGFKQMSSHRLKEGELGLILDFTFPLPPRPSADLPKEILERRLPRWEADVEWFKSHRRQAEAIFAGAGTGFDHRALAGTAWGAFNAVTERANYAGPNRDGEKAANSILYGSSANEMARAFQACMAVSTGCEIGKFSIN